MHFSQKFNDSSYKLKGQDNFSFLEEDKFITTIRSADIIADKAKRVDIDTKTQYVPGKRYNMRDKSPSNYSNQMNYLHREIYNYEDRDQKKVENVSAPSEFERGHDLNQQYNRYIFTDNFIDTIEDQNTRHIDFSNKEAFRMLKNKQWVDRLYEIGKRRQMSKSQSNLMTYQEAQDLKE